MPEPKEKQQPQQFIIKDVLPIGVEFSKVIFDIDEKLPTLHDYFVHAKDKAEEYAATLRLTPKQRQLFAQEFKESAETLEEMIIILSNHKENPSLKKIWGMQEPIVQLVTIQAFLKFANKQQNDAE